jgi:hypothetical protein
MGGAAAQCVHSIKHISEVHPTQQLDMLSSGKAQADAGSVRSYNVLPAQQHENKRGTCSAFSLFAPDAPLLLLAQAINIAVVVAAAIAPCGVSLIALGYLGEEREVAEVS